MIYFNFSFYYKFEYSSRAIYAGWAVTGKQEEYRVLTHGEIFWSLTFLNNL